MLHRVLVCVLALAMVCACDVRLPGSPPPSAGAVALQQGDVPNGLQRCSQSADVNDYFKTLKQTSPNAYSQEIAAWNSLKSKGATDGWITVFAENASMCANVFNNKPAGTRAPKLMQSIVFKFKDDKSALAAYNNGVFGLKSSDLASQPGVKRGSATNLGSNSVTVSENSAGTRVFVALWQQNVFTVRFESLNIAESDAKKASGNIHSRIG